MLQVLEVTDRAVVCVNLMDEAARKGLDVDARSLSRDLGVPVVPTVARRKQGMRDLVATVADVVSGETKTAPLRVEPPKKVKEAIGSLVPLIEDLAPGVPNARWVALRLLDGDHKVREALLSGELAEMASRQQQPSISQASRLTAIQGNL